MTKSNTPKQHGGDELIPTRAAYRRFGVSRYTFAHRWVKAGVVPEPVSINGRNYWKVSDLDALMERRACEPAEGGRA